MEEQKPLVQRFSVLGVPVDCVAKEDMPHVVTQLLENGESNQIVFLDLQKLMFARRNEEFRLCLNRAALVLPVTKSVAGGVRFMHGVRPDRYMPYDFIISLLAQLEERHHSVYLLGGSVKTLQKADKNLRGSFPRLLFVGKHTGFFKKKALDVITEAIRKASPALLLGSKGLKGEERWFLRFNERFNPGIAIYSADFFDITSGKKARPDRRAFESGHDRLTIILRKPWRIFRMFTHLRYGTLLVYYHMRGFK
jgi:N-acetylglucosaminyldiphosphoundecaprenol N-acetyl-beta-D-mannosaminyltransferase